MNSHANASSGSASGCLCIGCKGALCYSDKGSSSDAILDLIKCPDCDQCFPILKHGIVAFFEQPEQAVAEAYAALYQTAARWQSSSDSLSKALKDSQRKQALLPILKAQHDNRELFDHWAKSIEELVKPSALMEVKFSPTQTQYGYSFNYLVRDWTDDPDAISEVGKILNAAKQALRLSDIQGRACMLGMGAGRFALELCDYFDHIYGIDNSLGQVLQYHELLEGDISFWQINTKNQTHQKNAVSKRLASIPQTLKAKADKVSYLWSDALNTPFENNYFDWVFSIYFSDIKPLPELIKEVKRVLRSGGMFFHCGPLEYHFAELEHHYSFDEFKQYFLNNGFEFIHESSCENSAQINVEKSLFARQQYNEKVLLLRLT